MAAFADVTSLMGEYMLKGWVLTDKTCSTPECSIPLMRSPRGQSPEVYFCANCHGNAATAAQVSTQPVTQSTSSDTNASSGLHPSRTSTPLTEVSNHEDSDEEFELPPETEQSRRRREQSDLASTEIGSRLLKGWAMLGDECPNESCYGIPLVRPPSIRGEKSPQKECVVCGNVYLPEGNLQNQEVPMAHVAPASNTIDEKVLVVSSPSALAAGTKVSRKAKLPAVQERAQVPQPQSLVPFPFSSPLHALDTTDKALQDTLQTLSVRLTALSNSTPLDANTLGNTADAISKVIQALGHVKALQWSEARVQNS